MALPYTASVGTVAAGTGSVTPPLPAAWQQNDILVLVAETANQAFTTWPPTGWTAVPNPPTGFGTAGNAGATRLFLAWKRAGATESAPVLGDSGNHQVARIVAIRGCVTTGSPWIASATSNVTTSSSSVTWPSLTTSGNQNLVLYALGGDRDISSTADVSSLASSSGAITNLSIQVANWSTVGAGGGIFLAQGDQDALGDTGTVTATIVPQVYSIWTGVLQAAVSYAQNSLSCEYATIQAIESDKALSYNILEGVPYSWFARLTSNAYTWQEEGTVTPATYTAEASLSVEYTVFTEDTDTSAYSWFTIYDGPNPLWYAQESTVGNTTPIEGLDIDVAYNVLYPIQQSSPIFAYSIVSDTGIIYGSPSFPYGSAERDFTDTYNVVVLVPVEQSKSFEYHIHTYAERQDPFYYAIKGGAFASISPSYDVYGYAEQSLALTYRVFTSVEKSVGGLYNIKESVEQDISPAYNIETIPLTVAEQKEFEYNVVQSIISTTVYGYRVLTGTNTDKQVSYRLVGSAFKDIQSTYTLYASPISDKTVRYDVYEALILTPYRNLIVNYDVVVPTSVVPNVIGLPLSKARRTLENAGFHIGSVSYN